MFVNRLQRGATLIETLIALFVLAIGLLGFAALLTNSLTMNQRAFTLSQAMMLANSYTELMRNNRSAAADYGIALSQDPPSTVTDCTSVNCTSSQIAEWDQKQWFDVLTALLPEGDAEVVVNTLGDEITVAIDIHYELRIGRVGKGNSAEVTQMTNILSKLSTYSLSAEI